MIARLLFLVCLVAGVVAAQSAPPRKDIPAIAKAANGAIVSIITSDKGGHPVAQGTGFLVSTDGRIVTNYHVIKGASSAIVKLPDGAFYDVDGVVAFDKARDLAVIKAHGQNFRVVTLGDSDRVQVGEEIVAIGSPLSLESTVSNGIVSGIRIIEGEGGKFLQITAPISPGSSGGPLFNMAGEVVGITTLYVKGGENLNFAIPVNDAKLLLSAGSKVQDFPVETSDPLDALGIPATPNTAPSPSVSPTATAAEVLNWISGHMGMTHDTIPAARGGTVIQLVGTSSLSVQGCRVTVYTRFVGQDTLGNVFPSTTQWGPFDLNNLRPDEISEVSNRRLQIKAVTAIPLVMTDNRGPSSTDMVGYLLIEFDSDDLVARQAHAWHDAIVACGGKKTQDDLY
jgi:Trypsin-like peptidase domain